MTTIFLIALWIGVLIAPFLLDHEANKEGHEDE